MNTESLIEHLHGTRIVGTIPITEKVLNDAANQTIAARGGRIRAFEIQIGADNYLQVGVNVAIGPISKWFRPELVVEPRFSAESPTIVLTVASSGYAGLMWLAELFAKEYVPQGLTITGRQLTLDLASLPPLAPYRQLLRHLKSVEMTSTPGRLSISFEIRIADGPVDTETYRY
jgi:hypothetical protein